MLLKDAEWKMAIVLEPIKWIREEFSKAGVNTLAKDLIGVYELLGHGDGVLRVGEGQVKARINAHLADNRFSPPTVLAFRYLAVAEPEDGKILEKLRIQEYENETGVLPRFQEIRA